MKLDAFLTLVLKLDALLTLARALCPWAVEPLPPVVFLDAPAYEALAHGHNLPLGTLGFTTWLASPEGAVLDAKVYLSPGADDRILCHEFKHIQLGHWHN